MRRWWWWATWWWTWRTPWSTKNCALTKCSDAALEPATVAAPRVAVSFADGARQAVLDAELASVSFSFPTCAVVLVRGLEPLPLGPFPVPPPPGPLPPPEPEPVPPPEPELPLPPAALGVGTRASTARPLLPAPLA